MSDGELLSLVFVSDRAKVTKGLPDVVAIMEGKVGHCQKNITDTLRSVKSVATGYRFMKTFHLLSKRLLHFFRSSCPRFNPEKQVVPVSLFQIWSFSWLISFFSLCVWHATSTVTQHHRSSGSGTTRSLLTRTFIPSPMNKSAAPSTSTRSGWKILENTASLCAISLAQRRLVWPWAFTGTGRSLQQTLWRWVKTADWVRNSCSASDTTKKKLARCVKCKQKQNMMMENSETPYLILKITKTT